MKKKSGNRNRSARDKQEPLGHGDHWRALGFEGEHLMQLLQLIAQEAEIKGEGPVPWPGETVQRLCHAELSWKELRLAILLGQIPQDEVLKALSAFPVLSRTSTWTLEVDEVCDSYGAFEGVVKATADTGHPLQWFDPYFARDADKWRQLGRVRVGLAGLALSMEPFDPKPIVVREGPRVEELRSELRAEGRLQEAADPELSVTYHTDQMRTLYSSFHDHHEFIGRVLRVAKTGLGSWIQGWRIEIECRHDDFNTGRSLPVYVFPPALGSFEVPKRGDLVSGLLWLQGQYQGPAQDMAC